VVAIRRANCLHKTHQAVTGKEYGVRYANKATVLRMLDRESRQVRAKVVRDTKRETLQIRNHEKRQVRFAGLHGHGSRL
jgi:hypothetical protein